MSNIKEKKTLLVNTNQENVYINTGQNVIIENQSEGNTVFYVMFTYIIKHILLIV